MIKKESFVASFDDMTANLDDRETTLLLHQLKEQIKNKNDAISDLQAENDRIRVELKRFCKETLKQEETALQFEKENVELTSHIKDLKQEVHERKDSFRDEEEEFEEYGQDLKKELRIVAKNCRSLQSKLKKAEKAICSIPLGDFEKTEAALELIGQIKQLNADNILITNSLSNNTRVS